MSFAIRSRAKSGANAFDDGCASSTPAKREARPQHARIAGRGGQERIEHAGIEPLARRDRARLGDRGHGRARDEVVAELRGLPGAVAADEDDEPAERVEERERAAEGHHATPDHDRERRILGPARAAAHGRVEDVELAALGRKPARKLGRAGRHVDEERPGSCGAPHAPLPEDDLLDRGWRRQRHEDDVGLRGGVGGRLRDGRPERLGAQRIDVAGDDVVAGRDEVACHRPAHRAEADHCDPRHGG